jgi:hypothetical protein
VLGGLLEFDSLELLTNHDFTMTISSPSIVTAPSGTPESSRHCSLTPTYLNHTPKSSYLGRRRALPPLHSGTADDILRLPERHRGDYYLKGCIEVRMWMLFLRERNVVRISANHNRGVTFRGYCEIPNGFGRVALLWRA